MRTSIEVDHQLEMAAHRAMTGANVHNLRGALQTYINACYVGDAEIAEKARQELQSLLSKAAQLRYNVERRNKEE